jgi:hypothetical protein
MDGRTIPEIFIEKGEKPWKMFQACLKELEEDG